MPGTTARLFFALWPDEVARATLATAVAPVVREVITACSNRRETAGARSVPPANYHFTLSFLGSVPLTEIERLCSIATQSSDAFRQSAYGPIAITLDCLDHWRKPQVLVATSADAPPAAAALAEQLSHALIAADFSPDTKPFRPHLTLARKVTAPFPASSLPPQRLTFQEFALVESRTGPEGSIYAVVRTFPIS